MRLKKILLTLLVTVTFVLTPQSGEVKSLDVSLQRCNFSQSSEAYITYLSSLLDYERILQFFDDILYRNSCQQDDIYNIIRLSENVRQQLRSAYYSCDYEKIDEKEDTFNRYDMELYFMRNFVDCGSVIGCLVLEVPLDELKGRMKEKFVDKKQMFDARTFDVLFEEFASKYGARLDEYRDCEDPNWRELIDKLEQFGETMGGFNDPIFDEVARDFNQTLVTDDIDIVTLDSFETQMKEFLAGKIAVNINGVEAEKGVEQLAEEFFKHAPSAPTFDEFSDTESEEKERYLREVDTAELMGRYRIRYLEGSDTAVERFIQMMGELLATIQDTFDTMSSVRTCVQDTGDKQCENK